MVLSSKAYKLPGKNPQVQKSAILDVYFHKRQLYIISEYLDLSLLELGFEQLPLKEWEMATIMREVVYPPTALPPQVLNFSDP